MIDELERGDQLQVGEHIFEVLHPSQDMVTSKNNDSLVLAFFSWRETVPVHWRS
ncbi:hypothetical protein ACEQPO_19645 [Bacillus sp. SL00103]